MVGPIEEAEAKAKTLIGEDEKKAAPTKAEGKGEGKPEAKADAKAAKPEAKK
jgi:hypothetical protein